MHHRNASVSKEWGEIGFGSSKRDGWAYEVSYYDWDQGPVLVEKTYHEKEAYAKSAAFKWEVYGFLYDGEDNE